MANSLKQMGTRGAKDAAQKALTGIELQKLLPNARVVYSSATGATEVSNLAYAERLGLWGKGTPFPTKLDFINEIGSGGIAAMELVARDMKAMGHYVARNLSYDDVKYDRLEHNLTGDQRQIYDKLAEAWQVVLRNINSALAMTAPDTGRGGENPRPDAKQRRNAMSAFWGAHQRFFNQIITSMQMPSVIRGIEQDLRDGKQAVLQLVNTNEAAQGRAIAKRGLEGGAEDELYEDLDLSPKDQLMQMVDKSFPTAQIERYTDENGNEATREVRDSKGNIVHNPEALAMKNRLLDELASIRGVPEGPLDMAINHFGVDNVAEVTGRKERIVRKPDKQGIVRAQKEVRPGSANTVEVDAFQNGKKKVLIFSEAGGTGRSYHAELSAPSAGAQRSHYLVQAGWRADKAIQGFGRTHRTNQASAPIFHLVTTDLQGQKRFISSIARRLSQLGALTKGERRAGEAGLFGPRDNLEGAEARAALQNFWRDMQSGRVQGISPRDFEAQTGLELNNRKAEPNDPPEIPRFLNRLLSLKFDMQNQVFGEFERRLGDAIDRASADGSLDVGTETYRADRIRKDAEQTVHTDPQSGAETKYVRLSADHRNYPASFADVVGQKSRVTGYKAPMAFFRSTRTGKIVAAADGGDRTDAKTGSVFPQYRLADPLQWRYVDRSNVDYGRGYEKITDQAAARRMWDEQVKAVPSYRSEDVHLITGAILPIWDRLQGTPKVFRLQTDQGERLLGRVIDERQIGPVLKALGAEEAAKQFTPEQAVGRLMAGDQASLANGWTLRRAMVAGEPRIELRGPYFAHRQELESNGLFSERIGSDMRWFVPTGERTAEVLGRLLSDHPLAGFEGRGGIELAEGEIPRGWDAVGGSRFRPMADEWSSFRGDAESHNAARDFVRSLGSATGNEHVVVLDRNGNAIHVGTNDEPGRVTFPVSDERALDPNAGLTAHHNHSDGSLSGADLQGTTYPGIRQVVAHTPSGDIFSATLTPEVRSAALQSSGVVRNLVGLAWQKAQDVIKPALKMQIVSGKLSAGIANRIYADLMNRALEAAGLTNYISTRAPEGLSPTVRDSIIRRAAAAVADNVNFRLGIEAPTDGEIRGRVADRSAVAIRPDRAMAEISRIHAENAGQSAGAGGAPPGTAGTGGAGERAAAMVGAGPGISLAEERPDFSDVADSAIVEDALGPPGRGTPPPSAFERLGEGLGTAPGSPGYDRHDFNFINKDFTFPRSKAAYDPISTPKWIAELSKKRYGAQLLDGYRQALSSWQGKLAAAWQKLFSAMELLTLDGREVPLDGRAVIVENRNHPLAALSKPGDVVRLETPEEIGMFTDYRRAMNRVWNDLTGEIARKYGGEGATSSRDLEEMARQSGNPATARQLQRAARIISALEWQRRASYLPLMRSGDYFIRVTPKAGTPDKPGILGWTGDGFPPTTMFRLLDAYSPWERAIGGRRSGTPGRAQKAVDDLRGQFPEAEYNIDHGFVGDRFADENAVRNLQIPAVEKLMMLVGSDVRNQIADRLRSTSDLGRDEARRAAGQTYDGIVDSVLGQVYDERLAGFRKPRRGIPGYDADFAQSTGKYLGWLSNYTSDIRYRDDIEAADQKIAEHPDPRTRAFWRDWDRREEDRADQMGAPLMRARQAAFYWLLGLNAASTAKITLHGPLLGVPTLTTGLGVTGRSMAAASYLNAARQMLRGVHVTADGLALDPTRSGGLTADERALIADAETKGILHPQGMEELAAIRGGGEQALTEQARFGRRVLNILGSNVSMADRLIRSSMLLAGYRTALREGMDTINKVWDRDETWRQAKDKSPAAFAQFMVDRTAGIWGDVNRLPIFRSKIGAMVGQFRTYETNYLSTLHQLMWHMGPEGRVSAALMLGGLGMLGGTLALPFATDAKNALQYTWNGIQTMLGNVGTDFETEMRNAMDAMFPGSGMGEDVLHGFRPFGIDYGSVGFGDLVSRNIEPPLGLVAGAGPAAGVAIGSAYRAGERLASGQGYKAALREAMPNAVKHMMDALYPESSLASAGTGWQSMPASELSEADRVRMGLGFQTASHQRQMERYQQVWNAQDQFKNAISAAENRIANLTSRGEDTEAAVEQLQGVVKQAEERGVFGPAQMGMMRRQIAARILQRMHPELPSRTMQRMQQQGALPPPP